MIGRSALQIWRVIASSERCMAVAEIAAAEPVQKALVQSKAPLGVALANLVTQGHLACDHAPFASRSWWFGPASRLPAGEVEPARVRPAHVVVSTASVRDQDAWRRDAEPDKPIVLRPGAMDSNRLPSRRGSRLYWPDGSVTSLDGATVHVEKATP